MPGTPKEYRENIVIHREGDIFRVVYYNRYSTEYIGEFPSISKAVYKAKFIRRTMTFQGQYPEIIYALDD